MPNPVTSARNAIASLLFISHTRDSTIEIPLIECFPLLVTIHLRNREFVVQAGH
jgi:hypothetical protein